MKRNMIKISFVALLSVLLIQGCKKDDDQVPVPQPKINEGEVITTLQLHFTDTASVHPDVWAVFRDPDGDGGAAPDIFDTIKLKPNTTYAVTLLLLNETESPADTISNEVAEEGAEHMFFYHHTTVGITTVYDDLDDGSPQRPIGLATKWRTGNAANGTSQVILKHQPGVKDGTEAPGETDIDVLFQTIIQ